MDLVRNRMKSINIKVEKYFRGFAKEMPHNFIKCFWISLGIFDDKVISTKYE